MRATKEFLEGTLNIKLKKITAAFVDDKKHIHCENLIGETTLPLGVAGPIKIKNQEEKVKDYFIPLATTEGALVASVNRGCKAINQSGGVKVYIKRLGTTRGPVYETGDVEKGLWFLSWLRKNETKIKKEAEKTSSHLKYLRHEGRVIGPYVYLRFYFDTAEAMGMNMVTIATAAINQLIEKETKIKCLSLSGNFCVDKKPSWMNFINKRGFEGWGEAVFKKETIKKVLKSSGEEIFQTWLSKCMIGSAISGALGFNAHFANIVAAFFAATGQDLAHVVEGSLGMTIVKALKNGDLYFSVYLPAIMLGTVGGGTKLETKREALSIIKAQNSQDLAGVLTAAVLAGEVSLLASLAEGSLAESHKKLGR